MSLRRPNRVSPSTASLAIGGTVGDGLVYNPLQKLGESQAVPTAGATVPGVNVYGIQLPPISRPPLSPPTLS